MFNLTRTLYETNDGEREKLLSLKNYVNVFQARLIILYLLNNEIPFHYLIYNPEGFGRLKIKHLAVVFGPENKKSFEEFCRSNGLKIDMSENIVILD